MSRRHTWFTDLYPVWLIAFATIGLIRPETLQWFRGPWVVWALSLVMLGMGLTLKAEDFQRLLRMPGSIALGFLAHYTIMPLSGWAVARLLHLDAGFALGLILVASCPSGTASNVISFLARANVALAVTVTLASTLLAFLMTPFWCKTLAGAYVPVDAAKLCLSTLQIAVAPVLLGVGCNWRFPRAVARISRFGPIVSVLALMFITGGIVAQNAPAVLANAGKLALAAVLLHVLGFGVGYLLAKILGHPEDVARTISIEVGMQNGGLAATLAGKNFPTQPMAAVPAVFSALVQTLLGSLAASYWRARPPSTSPSTSPSTPTSHPRSSTYYWKCDRPAAFHGTASRPVEQRYERELLELLRHRFPGKPLSLRPSAAQGNHIAWHVSLDGSELFARLEDGPERDDFLEVESRLLQEVRALGVPAPQVFETDASRQSVPFAWQLLETIPCEDLNRLHRAGSLDGPRAARKIGAAVARWQSCQPPGFGPFDPATLRRSGSLAGFHARYEDYFRLHLERHLEFLVARAFLPASGATAIQEEIERHRSLLELERGCLVHKDLALWNILGTDQEVAAFIDWDDAISGDPLDDLSLLACFHDRAFLTAAFEGYQSVRPLPPDAWRRFWLHLLRNMLVKAVIRVGAGYFERDEGFFLIGSGGSGADLRRTTEERLSLALRGLRSHADLSLLP